MSKKKKHPAQPRPAPTAAAGSATPQSKAHVFAILGIMVLGAALYANTLSSPFMWDEVPLIIENPIIRDWGYFIEPSKAADFMGYDSFVRRYVSYATFALNHSIHGIRPLGYHVFNIGVHLLSAALLYITVLLLWQSPLLRGADGRMQALFAGALFASHPLQTEAVTYIFQRHASLVAFFYILSVALYLRWRVSDGKAGVWWYAGAIASAVLAMKTKENAFTLPLVIALCEYVFFEGPLSRRLIRLIPMLLTLAVIPATLLSLHQASAIGGEVMVNPGEVVNKPAYFVTQLRVMVTYLRLLILPVNQNLDHDYIVHDSFAEPSIIASAIALAALVASGLWLVRRGRQYNPALAVAGFGILWFFISISVESSIIPIPMLISEYRMYLPSAGLFMTAAVLVPMGVESALHGRGKRASLAVMATVIALLSCAALMRNAEWKSQVSLWGDVVGKSPRKTRGLTHLGLAYDEAGDYRRSLEVYRHTLELNPKLDEVWYDIGVVEAKLGNTESALASYTKALELNPSNSGAHNNMGVLLNDMGRTEDALTHFRASAALQPNSPSARNNLGAILMRTNRFDEALPEFLALLRLTPPDSELYNIIGVIYYKQGKMTEAKGYYEEAVRLNPGNPNARINLSRVLYERGAFTEAEAHAEAAVRLAPGNAEFRQMLEAAKARAQMR